MQRYDIYGFPEIIGAEEGSWCQYEDVKKLEAQMESLTGERNGLLRHSSEFDQPMIKSLAKENEKLEEFTTAIEKMKAHLSELED